MNKFQSFFYHNMIKLKISITQNANIMNEKSKVLQEFITANPDSKKFIYGYNLKIQY